MSVVGKEVGSVSAETRERARAVLLDELSRAARTDLAGLPDAAVLREDVPVDSLALLDVFLRVEERLGVEIDEEALAEVRTVGDLVACIVSSRAAGEAR
jgi:acyl carrier protein